jgi:hypothetical protein
VDGPGPHDDGNGGGGTITGPITDDKPNALGVKGKAGVALLVVGGLGVIAGITMVAIKPTYFDQGDPEAFKYRTTDPPGYAALGVGAAGLIVGAVLLGLDRKQAKRKGAGKAEARVHTWGGPQGAGIGVVGRF